MKDKKDKKKAGSIIGAFFMAVFGIACLALLGSFFVGMFEQDGYFQKADDKCILLGYDYSDPYGLEDGYWSCCSSVYVDHIRVEPECKAYSIDFLVG